MKPSSIVDFKPPAKKQEVAVEAETEELTKKEEKDKPEKRKGDKFLIFVVVVVMVYFAASVLGKSGWFGPLSAFSDDNFGQGVFLFIGLLTAGILVGNRLGKEIWGVARVILFIMLILVGIYTVSKSLWPEIAPRETIIEIGNNISFKTKKLAKKKKFTAQEKFDIALANTIVEMGEKPKEIELTHQKPYQDIVVNNMAKVYVLSLKRYNVDSKAGTELKWQTGWKWGPDITQKGFHIIQDMYGNKKIKLRFRIDKSPVKILYWVISN